MGEAMTRSSSLERSTQETQVSLALALDGTGAGSRFVSEYIGNLFGEFLGIVGVKAETVGVVRTQSLDDSRYTSMNQWRTQSHRIQYQIA